MFPHPRAGQQPTMLAKLKLEGRFRTLLVERFGPPPEPDAFPALRLTEEEAATMIEAVGLDGAAEMLVEVLIVKVHELKATLEEICPDCGQSHFSFLPVDPDAL